MAYSKFILMSNKDGNIKNIITQNTKITIEYNGKPQGCEDKDCQMIIETSSENFGQIKDRNIHVYFFLSDQEESSCFEFDIFSDSTSFLYVKEKKTFEFSKTFALANISQKIKIKEDDLSNEKIGDQKTLKELLMQIKDLKVAAKQ